MAALLAAGCSSEEAIQHVNACIAVFEDPLKRFAVEMSHWCSLFQSMA